jgi:hypothetical protein
MSTARFRTLAVLLAGIAFGATGAWLLHESQSAALAQSAKTNQASPATPDLAEQIAAIRGKLPSQSHAMQDVGYHFTNLWFAGQKENWPLAEFYWAETLSHMHWAVRIVPVRKDTKGKDVDLAPILEGFENGPFRDLHTAIAAKDKAAFEKQYRTSLETCYGCHKSSDKPYLRPQIPEHPEVQIINFDPQATWPQG